MFVLGLLPETGYCNRSYILSQSKNNIEYDGLSYCRIWKTVNNYTMDDSKIIDKIKEVRDFLFDHMDAHAVTYPPGDSDYCEPLKETDIKYVPCESANDVFFLIDIQGKFDEQTAFITEVIRNMDLRRYSGSVTVLANTQYNQSIFDYIDENKMTIFTPLTPLAYNTTKSQCASCRVAWFNKS